METGTKFEPTETQQLLVTVAWDLDWDFSVDELCTKAGFETRKPYYSAMRHADFREYWLSESARWCAMGAPRVRSAVLRAATQDNVKGNATDRRTFLDGFDDDFIPRSKKEVQHSGQMGVNFSKMTDDELARAEATLRKKGEDGRPVDDRTPTDSDD